MKNENSPATLEKAVKPKPTTPWKPSSVMAVKNKDAAYRYRWVRKDLLDKRLDEGWEPVVKTEKTRIEAPEATVVDGSPLTTYITKRNLVLCRMPEEMAQSRAAYYRKLSDGGLQKVVEELQKETHLGDGKGSTAYGNITIGRPGS